MFLAFVVLLLSATTTYQINENRQAKAAVCALRNDVQIRRDRTVAYLEEHPKGIVSPKTGAVIITAAELQRSIDGQTSTLAALDAHIDCPPAVDPEADP